MTMTTTTKNITPDEANADLEAAFQMALHDALKSTDKPTAALLEVCRKTVEDARAHRRWMTEQSQLNAGAAVTAQAPVNAVSSGASSGANTGAVAGEAPEPEPTPLMIGGIDVARLPFPVKRRGVENPPQAQRAPVKATASSDAEPPYGVDGDEPRDWRGLNSVPFLSPND
jgi:hypothetical protein